MKGRQFQQTVRLSRIQAYGGMMDVLVVRRCRRGGYELLDTYGKYVGCAFTLDQAYRFAAASGVPIFFELQAAEERPMDEQRGRWLDPLRDVVARVLRGRL